MIVISLRAEAESMPPRALGSPPALKVFSQYSGPIGWNVSNVDSAQAQRAEILREAFVEFWHAPDCLTISLDDCGLVATLRVMSH